MLTVTASDTVTLVVVAVIAQLVPAWMAPSGSSGTVSGEAVPVIVGTVPLMLQPPPVPVQNLLAGAVKAELALPSATRTIVKLMYCEPDPTFGAPGIAAPGIVPLQLLPSAELNV